MFTNKMKKIVTLLMLSAMALLLQESVLARSGGGFSNGGLGGGGGGMGYTGGGGFRAGGFNHGHGSFNGGLNTNGAVNRTFVPGRPNRSFVSFTPSTGFPGFEGRDLPVVGFNSKTTLNYPRGSSFNKGKSRFGFGGKQGRFDGGHFGGRDFDHHHFNGGDRFCRNHYFFNPCFADFCVGGGFFYNPYYYSYPYYYGYDYGAYPNNYNTYNYYFTNPETTAPNVTTDYYNQRGAGARSVQTDTYFNNGVNAFKSGDYLKAAVKFDYAMQSAPQDKALPFAYAQAVFAGGKYPQAAAAVRNAVAKITPETDGIFYPRGLYSSETEINRQIADLSRAATTNNNNMSLQLLLGYNWLGMGQLDKARTALENIGDDPVNGPTAKALLKLVDKLQTNQKAMPPTQTPVTPKTDTPQVETAPDTPSTEEAPQIDTSPEDGPIG
jgi:hypothetical protein